MERKVFSKEWWKSLIIMLMAVVGMGIGVAFLKIANFGTDPCSAMNFGVSKNIGWSFGNYTLFFNAIFLVFVLIFGRKLIGPGTIANMVVIGYVADFCLWLWEKVFHFTMTPTLTVRFLILFPALIFFVFVAAVYMQSDHGVAPYDAFPFIVSEWLEKATGKKFWFLIIRPLVDATGALIGYLTGGATGVTTVLMVVLLGPTVNWVGKLMKKRKNAN